MKTPFVHNQLVNSIIQSVARGESATDVPLDPWSHYFKKVLQFQRFNDRNLFFIFLRVEVNDMDNIPRIEDSEYNLVG